MTDTVLKAVNKEPETPEQAESRRVAECRAEIMQSLQKHECTLKGRVQLGTKPVGDSEGVFVEASVARIDVLPIPRRG